MSLEIGDIFIGNFPETQGFGSNPVYYKKFGLAGHEGIDFGLPVGIPIIAATDGIIARDTDNAVAGKNYGINVVLWDKKQLCKTYYCHLSSNVVFVGQAVFKGQLLGFSGNTGNTTGPHLHFNLCKTDDKGNILNTTNGYSGFLNADDKRIAEWKITNPKEPIKPPEIITPPGNNDQALATKFLVEAFEILPEDDNLKLGNLEGFTRQIVEEHKTYPQILKDSKAFEAFIEKWFQEWGIKEDPTKSHQVLVEEEMGKLLSYEDRATSYRNGIEEVVGSFNDDSALLKALGAAKDDKQVLVDKVDKLTKQVDDLKKKQEVKYSFNVLGFNVKVFNKKVIK